MANFIRLLLPASEDGAARTDVHVRIQKARGSFSKLRKVWLSTSTRQDTNIRGFLMPV
jgi:hypothetical protein